MNDYLKIGSAADLSGKDRILYRALEILPGFLSWTTILGVIFLSWQKPIWIAFFIITFDIYWLIKTVFLSVHLRANWKRMKKNLNTDWKEKIQNVRLSTADYRLPLPEIWQLVILVNFLLLFVVMFFLFFLSHLETFLKYVPI